MGIKRTDDVAYLSQEYSPLEELTDTAPSDSNTGYKQVITDARFKLIGNFDDASDTTYELDPDELESSVSRWFEKYRALLRFYALTKFRSKLAQKISWAIAGDGLSPKLSVQFDQVGKLLQEVMAELAYLGIYVGYVPGLVVRNGLKMRDVHVDIFEPSVSSEV